MCFESALTEAMTAGELNDTEMAYVSKFPHDEVTETKKYWINQMNMLKTW